RLCLPLVHEKVSTMLYWFDTVPRSSLTPVPTENSPVIVNWYMPGKMSLLPRVAPISDRLIASVGMFAKMKRLYPRRSSLILVALNTCVSVRDKKRFCCVSVRGNASELAVPYGFATEPLSQNQRPEILSLPSRMRRSQLIVYWL